MKEDNRRILFSCLIILIVVGIFLSLLFIIGAGILIFG